MCALEPIFLACLAVILAADEWLRFWFMVCLKSFIFFSRQFVSFYYFRKIASGGHIKKTIFII